MNGLPEAGEIFQFAADDRSARRLVEKRQRNRELERASGPTLQDVHSRLQSGEVKALNLIIKTDVQGTIDAVKSSLESVSTQQTKVNIIHVASGSITESDVLLGVASKAIIVGFNSRPEPGARALANQEGVEIRFYDVIYNLADDVEQALLGLLEPVFRDIIEGLATIRAVFNLSRRARVAGIYVNDGRIARDSAIHVRRNNRQLFVGSIASLKHFKDDVREVTTGFEGGVTLDGFQNFQEGDILEAHRTEQVT